MENSKSIKTKTIHNLLDIDVNITSEDCQEECKEALLTEKDRTRPKESTKRRELSESLCRCFCLYHQVCLLDQTTGKYQSLNPRNHINYNVFS